MNKLISVIVPTYNCQDFVTEGLDSIMNQLPENCELVVVDDGSTDNTAKKLAKYEKNNQNEKLKIIYAQHSGVSGGRNIGLDNASGEYVTFMDCDDCLQSDFFEKTLPLVEKKAELYIFGIERIPLEGENEVWSVKDNFYKTLSSFADTYIRERNLLIYSNCNKFYRRSIIEKNNIRFEDGLSFGEDRLMNFAYLTALNLEENFNGIITSSILQLRYLQRSTDSQSSKHVPNYFNLALRLHKEKLNCFLQLSKGTTEEERKYFVSSNISSEIKMAADRFIDHPEEILENLNEMNKIVFGGPFDWNEQVDVLIVLGSTQCEYRAETALIAWFKHQNIPVIVSGGNKTSAYGEEKYEADYMEEYLVKHGIPQKYIYKEKRAKNTEENLIYSNRILKNLINEGFNISKIGIVTAGFHINRTRIIAKNRITIPYEKLCYLPGYGHYTKPWNWFLNEEAKKIVADELKKIYIENSEIQI